MSTGITLTGGNIVTPLTMKIALTVGNMATLMMKIALEEYNGSSN